MKKLVTLLLLLSLPFVLGSVRVEEKTVERAKERITFYDGEWNFVEG